MQIFVGVQNELTLVTLLQSSAKITKIRQTEDILGKFALQASSCIHFWLKTVNATRCLKTKLTQNVFSVTNFGDFCTILQESHQSLFILATYKNLHFSARTDCF